MGDLISLYLWVIVLSRNLTFIPPTHNHMISITACKHVDFKNIVYSACQWLFEVF